MDGSWALTIAVAAAGASAGCGPAAGAEAPVAPIAATPAVTIERSPVGPSSAAPRHGETSHDDPDGAASPGDADEPNHGDARVDEAPVARGDDRPLPVVQTQEVTVGPKLSPAIYRRVIQRHRAQLTRCHQAALARHPKLGAVSLSFVVGPTGEVVSATADTDPRDDGYARCLERVITAIRFPGPDGGGTIVVTHPLHVAPEK